MQKRNVGFKKIANIKDLTIAEAIADGFKNKSDMVSWLFNLYGEKTLSVPMNKIILTWIEKDEFAKIGRTLNF